MICPIGFTLKERAPMLDKFFRTRFGRKLALKLAVCLFKCGYFTLQLFYLLFQNLRLVLYEQKPLPQNGGASVLHDKGLNISK